MPTETDKLKIKLIQPTDMFADDAFNNVIKDLDNKVVGIAHLTNGAHWEVWAKDTKYAKGDVVRTTTCKSNQYFQCIVGGTSGKDEPKNQGTGAQITDNTATWIINEIGGSGGNSGASVFIGEKYYTRSQLVIYNGVLYRSIKDHIAEQTFQLDIANWQKLYSNIREWADSTFYFSNEIVINDNKLYKCRTSHTSTTFDTDIANWELLGDFSLVNPFAISTNYEKGQLVTYNGILYRCNTRHTSSSVDFATDLTNWDIVYANTIDWDINTYYPKETIVLHDNLYYQCLTTHTSSADFEADRANWQLLSNVPANIQNWEISKYYYAGQCVLVDGIIYRCKTGHTSASTKFDDDSANWEAIGGGSVDIVFATDEDIDSLFD